MTPQDEQMVRRLHSCAAEPPPVIHLVPGTGDIGEKMAGFCDRLKQLAPDWKIKKEGELPFEAPALVIGRHGNIAYRVDPTGKFLAFILEGLENIGAGEGRRDADISELLTKIDLPVALKLYVAAQCPNCPHSIRLLQGLASRNLQIKLNIIDAQLFPQAALADQVRSVPTLILDDRLRWTGPVRADELLTQCIQRDPVQLSAASLRQLIEAGDAARVSEMMVAAGRLIPSFLELLVHDRWSVRLGAMVAAEYLADSSPALCLELCEMLWEGFDRLSPQIQGDVLQVMGQVDSDVIRSKLRQVASSSYDEEVKTAAAEILQEMAP